MFITPAAPVLTKIRVSKMLSACRHPSFSAQNSTEVKKTTFSRCSAQTHQAFKVIVAAPNSKFQFRRVEAMGGALRLLWPCQRIVPEPFQSLDPPNLELGIWRGVIGFPIWNLGIPTKWNSFFPNPNSELKIGKRPGRSKSSFAATKLALGV